MQEHNQNGIRYYTFDSFERAGVAHAIFTRLGGVSPKPWEALNVGGTVGDERERVLENLERTFRAVGRDPGSRFDVWQVHGAEVLPTQAPRLPDTPPQKADGILTDRAEVTLFMRFADCVPILLFDMRHGVAGIVHAGWLGTIKRVAAEAIAVMNREYSSRPDEILAGLGPSIGKDHYEVGREVISRVETAFGKQSEKFLYAKRLQGNDEKAYLDLWAANEFILQEAGVEQIETAGICTACHLDEWYSHRAEHGKTGRFGALIGM